MTDAASSEGKIASPSKYPFALYVVIAVLFIFLAFFASKLVPDDRASEWLTIASVAAAFLTVLWGVFFSVLKSDTITLTSQGSRSRVEEAVAELQRRLDSIDKTAFDIPAEDREELRRELAQSAGAALASDALRAELGQILERQRKLEEREIFATLSAQATTRITQQIAALGGRANVNLFIGLSLAVTGVGFLIYYVQTGLSQQSDLTNFFMQFFPRLSLVTIIELFSYFFLRLYKQAIDEIKYFQNEITNIDLKVLAVTLTERLSHDPGAVIAALASTERNFLVPKDQRIVAEVAEANIQTATQRILEIIRDVVPTGKANTNPTP